MRYLENNLKGKEKIFYSGQAYRKSQNKKDSIIRDQVGFEIIGSQDEKNDDKEIINTSLKSLKDFEYSSGTLTVGNVEIFNLLISKLDYEIAVKDLNIERSRFSPSASLNFSKSENDDFSSTIDKTDQETVKATITWPIIKGGENNKTFPKSNFIDEIKKLI